MSRIGKLKVQPSLLQSRYPKDYVTCLLKMVLVTHVLDLSSCCFQRISCTSFLEQHFCFFGVCSLFSFLKNCWSWDNIKISTPLMLFYVHMRINCELESLYRCPVRNSSPTPKSILQLWKGCMWPSLLFCQLCVSNLRCFTKWCKLVRYFKGRPHIYW